MRAQNCRGRTVEIILTLGLVELEQRVLPVLPVHHIMLAKIVVIFEQGGAHLLPRLRPDAPKTESKYELAFASCEVNLSGTRNVAIFRARVFPLHLKVLGEILPS